MTLPVALLAGGLATRLRPVTETIPKSLIEVAGKPFVLHQLELLCRAHVAHVVMCVGHLGEMVRDVVGDGRQFGIQVSYSFDGPQLLGTGGALRRALPLLGARFLVLYGDSYLNCDFAAISNAFVESGKLALMTVYRNDGKYDASNVSFRDGRILKYDKTQRGADMTHIDYGLGGFSASALVEYRDDAKFDLVSVYQALLSRDQLIGYEVHDRFYEIGSPSGLAEMRQLLEPKERA